MSDLRELVGTAIADEWMKHTARTRRLPGSNQLGDAAIAALSDALLSKAAIEAGAKAVRALDWEVDEVGFLPTAEDVARVSLEAALTAITAPTGDGIGQNGSTIGERMMTNARERIEDLVYEYGDFCRVENTSEERIDHEITSAATATDRILTIVRDVMLTDAAIDAFQNAEDGYEHDQFSGWVQATRAGMKAALDTALGDEDDGEKR